MAVALTGTNGEITALAALVAASLATALETAYDDFKGEPNLDAQTLARINAAVALLLPAAMIARKTA